MIYDELYKTFKEEIPEGYSIFEVKEKENLIDETDGIVQLVKKAFSNMNIKKKTASTGGGSDTNILNKNRLAAH